MLMPTLKKPTTLSALVCERIHGVKLKLYSGSLVGRTFQPRVRSQKKGSPGLMVVAEGRFEMAFWVAVSVAEVNVEGLIAVVWDKPPGSIWPYFVDGASLSTMISAFITRMPTMPMLTSCS